MAEFSQQEPVIIVLWCDDEGLAVEPAYALPPLDASRALLCRVVAVKQPVADQVLGVPTVRTVQEFKFAEDLFAMSAPGEETGQFKLG